MEQTRILWKNRKAMLEQAAKRLFYHNELRRDYRFCSALTLAAWFHEQLPAYAVLQHSAVRPSNFPNVERVFWRDVKKLVFQTRDTYYALPKAARRGMATRISAEIRKESH